MLVFFSLRMNINRKNIEDFYQNNWAGILPPKSIEILIELTCKAYKLNQGIDLSSSANKPKPHDLGQV